MNKAEIDAVAQAITDGHANKPGNDFTGRIDDAKTAIAAYDAIVAFRAAKQDAITASVKKVAAAKPVDPDAAPPASDDGTPDNAPESNVTPIKKKGKKGDTAA